MNDIDCSDVAFIYWSGSPRRNRPRLVPGHVAWHDWAKGFRNVGAHVVGINQRKSSVKIMVGRSIPSHIKCGIYNKE